MRIWKPSPIGVFSVKSFCAVVQGSPQSRHAIASYALAWTGLVPPSVKAFCWLAIVARISDAYMLRRGIRSEAILDSSVMCRSVEESANHLFIHCEVAPSVWSHLFRRYGILWFSPVH